MLLSPLVLISLQIAIGTKTGEILIYDLASSSLIETIKAHTASVWSLHVRPDKQALVSGSADKDVKFWEFESKDGKDGSVSIYLFSVHVRLILTQAQSGKFLTLVHIRTLKMTDDVLSVGIAPMGNF